MTNKGTWSLLCVLPNIEIPSTFEVGPFALVSRRDRRMRSILASSPAAQALFGRFLDQFGQTQSPTGLISRIASEQLGSDLVIAFRNAYAISCLISARQFALAARDSFRPMYSECFDVFPIYPSIDGRSLLVHSPALRGVYKPAKLQGQTTPGLPTGAFYQPEPDEDVRDDVTWMLERLYRHKNSMRPDRMFFRSLEVAYQALAMPSSNLSSLHDHGSKTGLWVNAFEVLAHPWGRKANINTVVDLLERASWNDPRLRSRIYRLWRRKRHRRSATPPAASPPVRGVTLASRLYRELYDARNHFLHGNEVGPLNIYPFKDRRRPDLLKLAPLVYRAALTVYVAKLRHKQEPTSRRTTKQRMSWGLVFKRLRSSQGNLEEALLKAVR